MNYTHGNSMTTVEMEKQFALMFGNICGIYAARDDVSGWTSSRNFRKTFAPI